MIKQYVYKILIFLRLKKKKKKSPYEFVDLGYNFADSFKDLVFCENISIRIKKLKSGLDSASCQIIDEVLEKLVCLIPRSTQKVLIDKKTLFSLRDLALQDEILRDKSWTSYPLSNYFMSEVYYFHNGVKLLSQHYINHYISNKTIVDVGAANGDSAFCFAKYNPKQILSFEANFEVFKKLQQNIITYNLPVKAFNLALSNHNGDFECADIDIMDSVDDMGGNGGVERNDTYKCNELNECKFATLDSVITGGGGNL